MRAEMGENDPRRAGSAQPARHFVTDSKSAQYLPLLPYRLGRTSPASIYCTAEVVDRE